MVIFKAGYFFMLGNRYINELLVYRFLCGSTVHPHVTIRKTLDLLERQ